jgi:transposase-like protein
MSGERRHFSTEQKAAILKRFLVDGVPLSDLCDEYKIVSVSRNASSAMV